jgi:hypothetical protein
MSATPSELGPAPLAPLEALLAADEALRQPLGRQARIHAQEEWRRAYFAAMRVMGPGEQIAHPDQPVAFVRSPDRLVIWRD